MDSAKKKKNRERKGKRDRRKKINLRGSKVNQAKKCFASVLYHTWHLHIEFLKSSELSNGIRKNSTRNLVEFIVFLERVFKHHWSAKK